MNNRPIRFKFFCPPAKGFVENYHFNGYVEDLYNDEDPTLVPVQYTGVDNIYEGDILLVTLPSWKKTYLGRIIYLNGGFALEIQSPEGPLSLLWLHQFQSYEATYKTLGNMYEHPQLLTSTP